MFILPGYKVLQPTEGKSQEKKSWCPTVVIQPVVYTCICGTGLTEIIIFPKKDTVCWSTKVALCTLGSWSNNSLRVKLWKIVLFLHQNYLYFYSIVFTSEIYFFFTLQDKTQYKQSNTLTCAKRGSANNSLTMTYCSFNLFYNTMGKSSVLDCPVKKCLTLIIKGWNSVNAKL